MKAFTIVALAAAVALPSTITAQSAHRLEATKANEYGLVYSLPLTQIDVTLEIEITRREPGEFCKYATKYLNVNDPIMEPSESVNLRRAAITTSGVPNPDERYLITLKSTPAPFILLSEEGLPLAINTEEVVETISAPDWQSVPAEPTPLQTPAAKQVITQEMLQSHSSAMRAKLAAEQIYQIRQTRSDIITGEADRLPPDGAAMKLVLENLDAREAALTAMFVGTTAVSTEVRTVSVTPSYNDLSQHVIARVSATEGIVDPSNLAGIPVYLSMKTIAEGQLPVNEKGETLPFPKGGVAYTIPGDVEIEITFNGRVVASANTAIAQRGVVYGMNPSNFTDKREPIFLIFDPATGAASKIGTAKR